MTTLTTSSTLVPIRIDVSSSSLPSSAAVSAIPPAWRAVDTLLMEPTVALDIPLVAHQWCADQARSVLDTSIAEAILSPTTISTVARQIATQWYSQNAAITKSASAIEKSTTTNATAVANATSGTGNLVPIVIRFEWQGLCLCDEFDWDPSLSTFNALCMAQTLAADLNLPEDVVNALAVDIAEQVCVAATVNRSITGTSSGNSIQHPSTVSSSITSTATGQTQDSTLEREDDFVRAAVTAATSDQGTTDPTATSGTNSGTAVTTKNNSSRTTAAWMVTPSSQATHVLHLASHYFPPRK
jgi:SNF5 / SMARCB1 / INI1